MNAPGELLDQLARAHGNRWTHSDELLALVVEKLDELSILFVQAWSDAKSKPKPRRPFRYPRPHARQLTKPRATLDDVRAFFRR